MDHFGECKKWNDYNEDYFMGIISLYPGIITDIEGYFSFLADNCKFYENIPLRYHTLN